MDDAAPTTLPVADSPRDCLSPRPPAESRIAPMKVSGDFVGRDNALFTGTSIVGTVPRTESPDNLETPRAEQLAVEHFDRVVAQIGRLRGRLTRLIPVQEALDGICRMRESSTDVDPLTREAHVSREAHVFRAPVAPTLATGAQGRMPGPSSPPASSNTPAEDDLEALSVIESDLSPLMEVESYAELIQRIRKITDKTNVRISRLTDTFIALMHTAASVRELAENTVDRIGHTELKEEADRHLMAIGRLVERLERLGLAEMIGSCAAERLTRSARALNKPTVDVLGGEAQSAIGVLTQIEKHHLIVEGLLHRDRQYRVNTVRLVVGYVFIVVCLLITLVVHWGRLAPGERTTFNEMSMLSMGVPLAVFLWSLIGSFAAMIHSFNRKPIYDFGDAFKSLITRPVQGVILGGAFYLVVSSGLFVLTGGSATDAGAAIGSAGRPADAIILVLSFLVGFSDRFGDSVFNALVNRYAFGTGEGDGERKAPTAATPSAKPTPGSAAG